jgi:hypothetical protein
MIPLKKKIIVDLNS